MAGQGTEKFGGYVVGQVYYALGCTVEEKRTKPPEHYTEDELMDDMLNAHKFAKTPEERDRLRQVAGIGTSRTRGGIIKGHVVRGMFERAKKGKGYQLRAAQAAFEILDKLPDMLKSVSMTASWEFGFGMIAKGEVSPAQVRQKIAATVTHYVRQALDEHGGSAGKSPPRA